VGSRVDIGRIRLLMVGTDGQVEKSPQMEV